MKLFDKLRRSTASGASDALPDGPADLEPDEHDAAGEVGQLLSTDPSQPSAPPAVLTTAPPIPDPGGYDPTHPCHAPVSGVDLVLFAQVTHRLRVAPAEERAALLADHGHTPETWSAVNTVWMARLGRMPYLCATYDQACRLP
jgi:hypothetical protein